MRHYHREEQRHLNDAERFRDHEYLADDGWVGPNEHAPSAPVHAESDAEPERPRSPATEAPPASERTHRPEVGRAVKGGIAATVDKVLGVMSRRRELGRLRAILMRRRTTRSVLRFLSRRRERAR